MIQEKELYRKIRFACHSESAEAFHLQSRIHRLRWFDRSDIWVKRDDELSFGVSGTKLRKHASIIPSLQQKGIEEVVVIGGAHSNNVLSAAQTLTENSIKMTPFLLGPPPQRTGNAKLLSLFFNEDEIHWIPRAEWSTCHNLANRYIEEKRSQGINIMLLPEGGHHESALPGALSLMVDILRNEKESGVVFDHLFIDAGTGMVAQSLLAGAAALERKTTFHIVVLADSFTDFKSGLAQVIQQTEKFLHLTITTLPDHHLYYPSVAKSFGSTNSTIFREIKRTAREDGILTDPVYSSKLFLTARKTILEQTLQGNILLIHSGGALALSGFMDHPIFAS
ncbi:MAG: pyridoxal-phosphate dependent enzyme [Candidatus Scalindua sp. AMX11]|nr:MAG: pyridoxal-phosphate dependent enzyme [Candidatus Scalindua sp.]NOG85941.1 pyridoxal-phosphate dependent enzyme [Planctomycetota bacterium]RZV91426.1 MAG: pyridoxal-phosphate dependent enzyme [Candidatus Scalindua sp. SCAELEC01]TDE65985.1 MAG: pyridoxal-phosphate dependent enzyme [Candidatus Scalindua sp. AMX11]GJQ59293.1 MAG: 1-aminocyclopropane-1-carboxylate deaminase [Candidatus Scalindua sp.]